MNKRKFNQVRSIYASGASEEVCVDLIVDFTDGVNSGFWIAKFYKEVLYQVKESHKIEMDYLKEQIAGLKERVEHLMKGNFHETP